MKYTNALQTGTYHRPGGGTTTKVHDSAIFLGDGDMDVLVTHDHLEDVVLQVESVRHGMAMGGEEKGGRNSNSRA